MTKTTIQRNEEYSSKKTILNQKTPFLEEIQKAKPKKQLIKPFSEMWFAS